MKAIETAKVLVASVRQELANGVKHCNKQGTELKTVEEILTCLRDEGEVTIQSRE